MAGKVTVRVEGLRELEKALAQLSQRTGKSVLTRTLKAAAEPMLLKAASLAPVDEMDLVESMAISKKLSRRQSKLHKRMFRDERAAVEMFLGPGQLPQAHMQEFGTEKDAPQPFLRPAWDAEKKPTLDRIADMLAKNIEKAARSAARRAARAKAG